MSFKCISIISLGGRFAQRSRMGYSILVDGVMSNISVKLF